MLWNLIFFEDVSVKCMVLSHHLYLFMDCVNISMLSCKTSTGGDVEIFLCKYSLIVTLIYE